MSRWQWIVAAAIAAGLVLVFRPASPDAPRGRDGCAELGVMVELRDARGDAGDAPPAIDLTTAGRAHSAATLCVEFRTAAEIEAGTSFTALLGEGRVAVSATVLYGGARQISLEYPGVQERSDAGLINGSVDVEGHVVRMRIARSDLPAGVDLDELVWQARSLAVGDGPNERYGDCAPGCG